MEETKPLLVEASKFFPILGINLKGPERYPASKYGFKLISLELSSFSLLAAGTATLPAGIQGLKAK